MGVAPEVSSTHPDVVAAEDIEGDLVPDDVGASVGENQHHAVLLPHQLDGVFQGELEGLSRVSGLSQPAQVFHRPGTPRQTPTYHLLGGNESLGWALKVCFPFPRQNPDKAKSSRVTRGLVIVGRNWAAFHLNSLFKVGDAVDVDPQLHHLLRLGPAVLDHAHPGVVTCKLKEQRCLMSSAFSVYKLLSTLQAPTHADEIHPAWRSRVTAGRLKEALKI